MPALRRPLDTGQRQASTDGTLANARGLWDTGQRQGSMGHWPTPGVHGTLAIHRRRLRRPTANSPRPHDQLRRLPAGDTGYHERRLLSRTRHQLKSAGSCQVSSSVKYLGSFVHRLCVILPRASARLSALAARMELLLAYMNTLGSFELCRVLQCWRSRCCATPVNISPRTTHACRAARAATSVGRNTSAVGW